MESDAYLPPKIKQSLANDRRVSALDIRITMSHGEVCLEGEVDTPEQVGAARETAERVAQRPVHVALRLRDYGLKPRTETIVVPPPGPPEVKTS